MEQPARRIRRMEKSKNYKVVLLPNGKFIPKPLNKKYIKDLFSILRKHQNSNDCRMKYVRLYITNNDICRGFEPYKCRDCFLCSRNVYNERDLRKAMLFLKRLM